MPKIQKSTFLWHTYDITSFLQQLRGENWDKEISSFARCHLKEIPIIPSSSTSRESDRYSILKSAVVDGFQIKNHLPWLYKLYKTQFLKLATNAINESVFCAVNPLYAINLNVQVGSEMRYECHVDSNPLQGMLYVTTHNENTGGQLVVSNITNSKNIQDVDKNCVKINPKKGRLIFFDARRHSHYVSSLTSDNMIRIAVAMNYYTKACAESDRPKELSKHLGLE